MKRYTHKALKANVEIVNQYSMPSGHFVGTMRLSNAKSVMFSKYNFDNRKCDLILAIGLPRDCQYAMMDECKRLRSCEAKTNALPGHFIITIYAKSTGDLAGHVAVCAETEDAATNMASMIFNNPPDSYGMERVSLYTV